MTWIVLTEATPGNRERPIAVNTDRVSFCSPLSKPGRARTSLHFDQVHTVDVLEPFEEVLLLLGRVSRVEGDQPCRPANG